MKSFGDMMKTAAKLQRQMTEAQAELAEARFEASAGGGIVRAVVDGRQGLRELHLEADALKDGDASLLEDLILTAVGEAQRTAETHMKEKMGKITGGMQLPF